MKTIGTCGTGKRYMVKWLQNDCVVVEKVGVMITVRGKAENEVIEICKRNLIDFKEV